MRSNVVRNRKSESGPIAVVLCVVLPVAITLAGGQSQSAFLALMAWSVTGGLLSSVAWLFVSRRTTNEITCKLFVAYLWVAYVVKPPITHYREPVTDDDIIYLYLCGMVTLGTIAGIVAYQAWQGTLAKRKQTTRRKNAPNLKLLCGICLVSGLLKFWVNRVMGWGLPGVEVTNGVPLVTGLLVIYCRYGMLMIVSVLAYFVARQSIEGKRNWLLILCSLVSIALYLGIDIINGSKYSMAYFAVVSLYIFWELSLSRRKGARLRRKKARQKRKGISLAAMFLSLAGVAVLLVAYKYVNYVRFAKIQLGDASVAEVIDFTVYHAKERGLSSTEALFDRISGYPIFRDALRMGNDLQIGFGDTLSSSNLMTEFTTNITGIENTNNSVGMTQPAFIVLLADQKGIKSVLYGFLYAVITLIFFDRLSIILVRDVEIGKIRAVVIGLFVIHVYLGGGNMLFFVKEWIVIVLTAMVCGSILAKQVARTDDGVLRRKNRAHIAT